MKAQPAIGLVGAGRWGRNILRDLIALGARVTVMDPDADARQQALGAGAYAAFPDFAQVPTGLDGFVVAASSAAHFRILQQLAGTGLPVFVEKPMVMDLAEARAIAASIPDRLFVMHKWRYHPGIETLATMAADGRFGKLQALSTRRLQAAHHHADMDAFWTLLPHDLSIIRHILGHVPPVETVTATPGAGGIDAVSATLSGGVRLEMSVLHHQTVRTVTAIFERATVCLADPMADHLEIRHGQGVERLPISSEMPLLREQRAFLAYLDGGTAPLSPVADELEIMARLDELRAKALGQ
ncbi:MAG: Gfo/Idh/MocA family oxidoreductase [Alphaproteobacteria bacterium]|nr:MAG: Gfo/Idh/MocA family oxidoreductase [Alphaproteobacteria bacterium]